MRGVRWKMHQAFDHAYRVHGPKVLAYLLTLCCGQREEAEDLLQRVYIDFWRARDRYDGRDPLSWLFGFAWHRFLVARRARQRFIAAHERYTLEYGPVPTRFQDPERAALLEACIDRLPSLDRSIIRLAYGISSLCEQPSPTQTDREIAHSLSLEDSTLWRPERIKTRRHRALQTLKSCLECGGPAGETITGVETQVIVPRPSENGSQPPLLRLVSLPEVADHPVSRAEQVHLETCEHCPCQLEAIARLEFELATDRQTRLELPEREPQASPGIPDLVLEPTSPLHAMRP